jgi:hypothetical protein
VTAQLAHGAAREQPRGHRQQHEADWRQGRPDHPQCRDAEGDDPGRGHPGGVGDQDRREGEEGKLQQVAGNAGEPEAKQLRHPGAESGAGQPPQRQEGQRDHDPRGTHDGEDARDRPGPGEHGEHRRQALIEDQ